MFQPVFQDALSKMQACHYPSADNPSVTRPYLPALLKGTEPIRCYCLPTMPPWLWPPEMLPSQGEPFLGPACTLVPLPHSPRLNPGAPRDLPNRQALLLLPSSVSSASLLITLTTLLCNLEICASPLLHYEHLGGGARIWLFMFMSPGHPVEVLQAGMPPSLKGSQTTPKHYAFSNFEHSISYTQLYHSQLGAFSKSIGWKA